MGKLMFKCIIKDGITIWRASDQSMSNGPFCVMGFRVFSKRSFFKTDLYFKKYCQII